MKRITRRALLGLIAAAGTVVVAGATVTFATTPKTLVYRGAKPNNGWFELEPADVVPYHCNGTDCLFESDFIITRLQYVAVHVDGRHIGESGRVADGAPYQWMDFDQRRGGARGQAVVWNDAIHGRSAH